MGSPAVRANLLTWGRFCVWTPIVVSIARTYVDGVAGPAAGRSLRSWRTPSHHPEHLKPKMDQGPKRNGTPY